MNYVKPGLGLVSLAASVAHTISTLDKQFPNLIQLHNR